MKIQVLLGLAVGICVPYFTLQRIQAFPALTLPQTPLDEAIAFDPSWIWPYASLALLVPLAPLLATTRDHLVRYARGLSLLCTVCFATFLLAPVLGPRPMGLPTDTGLYGLIVGVDRPANALPSLHAGLTVYSLLAGLRLLRGGASDRARLACVAGGSLWGALILFSTLATKQHQAWDLPAGMLLAWVAYAWAWRPDAAPKRARRRP